LSLDTFAGYDLLCVSQDPDFLIFDTAELRQWLRDQQPARAIDRLLIHHTWQPDYADFDGTNHLRLQAGMRKYHKETRGWVDIGQHFSVFPDGKVVTGRTLELDPACTKGANVGSICIENVGNFDEGGDVMTPIHREAILEAAAWVCERWWIPVDSEHVIYHHWFDLNTGRRTEGTGVTKTCPGSAFFGGNTVEAAEANFLPQVWMKIES
jgi:hypothetical protein